MDDDTKELIELIDESVIVERNRKVLPENHLTGREFHHPSGGIITQHWISPQKRFGEKGGWLTRLSYRGIEITSRMLPD